MARILVVDDDEVDREILRSLITHAEQEVVFAEAGEAALRLCEEESFDLVITDLVMPRMNGLRLIRELKRSSPSTDVIAISGRSPEHLLLAEDYGAVKTLTKPLQFDQLIDAVNQTLDSSP